MKQKHWCSTEVCANYIGIKQKCNTHLLDSCSDDGNHPGLTNFKFEFELFKAFSEKALKIQALTAISLMSFIEQNDTNAFLKREKSFKIPNSNPIQLVLGSLKRAH